MSKRILFAVVICFMTAATLMATPREIITLTSDWKVWPITSQKTRTGIQDVTVPHTWNATYPEGTILYNREMMVYQRELSITPEMEGKRLFLYFEDINSAADIFVNKQTVGTHQGEYTTCSFEITDYVVQGKSQLEIWVSNAYRTDILPISGDFNVYGGIHRPCHLIVTERNCISPVFYASPGVFVHQNKVSEKSADITIETIIFFKEMRNGLVLKITISDGKGKIVATSETPIVGENDMELILESGATAMRLVHYPHAESIYDLSDENGIILWTEIPFCGPGGYPYTGYVKSVEHNARQMVKELVCQKCNHPSVMFWGIFNEILVTEGRFVAYDNPVPFVKELNDIFKELDSFRLTTMATCVDQSYYLGTSDLLAWNKYFGWRSAEDSYVISSINPEALRVNRSWGYLSMVRPQGKERRFLLL